MRKARGGDDDGRSDLAGGSARGVATLNAPTVLNASVSLCQSLEQASDTPFAAVVKIKIGSVGASFKGKVQLVEAAVVEVAARVGELTRDPQ